MGLQQAVLIKYCKEGAERRLVECSAYLPYDSEDPPPSKEFEDLCVTVKRKTSFQLWGVTPMHTIGYGAAITAIVMGRPWWNF